MTQTDTKKQLYLYVKEFQWLDTRLQDEVQGHPKPNNIYSAVFENGLYKLVFNDNPFDPEGLVFPSLISFGEDRPYLCEMIQISRENLINLNLSETDLDKLLGWMNPPIQTKLILLGNDMKTQRMEEESNAIAIGNEVLSQLYNVDSCKYHTMLEIISAVINRIVVSHEDPAVPLTYNKNYATGINIAEALRALSIYTGDDRKTNHDINDLFTAIYSLVREVEMKIHSEE